MLMGPEHLSVSERTTVVHRFSLVFFMFDGWEIEGEASEAGVETSCCIENVRGRGF